MRRRRIVAAAVAAPLVSASVTIAAVIATGAHRRSGLTRAEARARLSSDDLLPDATVQNDRAGVIEAPPGAVWPWLVQLGQDKAGRGARRRPDRPRVAAPTGGPLPAVAP